MIKREHYIEKIRKFYDSEQIKIITGIKDSGKSVILNQIMAEISERSDNIIYLNFGDKRVSANIKTPDALLGYVEERVKRGKSYLFFDEMQVMSGWEAACAALQVLGYSLFVIGSDRDFMSESFEKALGGKYVSFRIRPFVYKEILEYADELGKNVTVDDYLELGGLPKRFEFDGKDAQLRYLDELDGAIIDGIIRRYKIRKEDLFLSLVDFVLQSNGKIFSEKAIYDRITAEHGSCSINTIMKYLDYLKEAYVIETAEQFSSRALRTLVFYTKIYNTDVAFNSIRRMDGQVDMGQNLENTVYNELIYRGYDVSVYDNGGKKIDILARKGGEEYFIQTVYGDQKSEIGLSESFRGLVGEAKKIVISYGAKRSLSGVICINLDDFLLMDSLGEIEFELTNENFAEETARSQTVRPKKKAVRVEKKPKVIKEEKFEEKKPEEKKKKVPFYQIF
ncbi:MAG: ATP-binding protein [Ruminococcaceae bacterium]|nr:ATP-binding protein [Oscillospiraceae bacterium]